MFLDGYQDVNKRNKMTQFKENFSLYRNTVKTEWRDLAQENKFYEEMVILSAWIGDMSVHRGNIGILQKSDNSKTFWRIDFGGSFRNTGAFRHFFADDMQPLNSKPARTTQNYLRTQHPKELRETEDFVNKLIKFAMLDNGIVRNLVDTAVQHVFHGF